MAEYMSEELQQKIREMEPLHHYDPKNSAFRVRIETDDGDEISAVTTTMPEPAIVKDGSTYKLITSITSKCTRVLDPKTDTVYFDNLKVWELGENRSEDIIRRPK